MSDWTALAGAVEAKPERERGRARRPGLSPLGGAALLLVLFLAVPLVALVWRALGEPGVWAAAGQPLVVRALRLSVVTTAITIAVAADIAFQGCLQMGGNREAWEGLRH